MNDRWRTLQLTGVVLGTAVVFIVDWLTPAGIEVWVLYLPVILIPVFFSSPRQVVVVGVACSALVVIAYFGSPQGANPPSWDVMNRVMGLMAIWLSAYTGIIVCNRTTRLGKALADLQQEADIRRRAEQVLKEHEERLRLAMQGAGMGTWDVCLRTGNVVWSETLFRMLGYEPVPSGEASQEMWLCRVHPNDRGQLLEAQETARRERSLHCAEYRIRRPDRQDPMWLAVFGRFFYDGQGEAVRFVGVSFDVTRRKELESEVLRNEVLRITAREQQQIGQELHDGMGQELTGLGLMAQSLAQRLPAASQEKRIATRLVAGFDQLHRKVRELSRGLIPVHVQTRGLSAALDDLAARTTEQFDISVTNECPEWVELPDHQTATEMFRIAQEAVTNAVRHGRPRQIRLTLLSEPNGLRLRIKDDGIGIQGRPKDSEGLGFRIMEYRAGLIGGLLQIGSSSEGGGTIVTLTVPRSESNDEKEPGSEACRGESLDRG
jgi:PAS domain S-box-containing protein